MRQILSGLVLFAALASTPAIAIGFGGFEGGYLASMQTLANPADYWPPLMDGQLVESDIRDAWTVGARLNLWKSGNKETVVYLTPHLMIQNIDWDHWNYSPDGNGGRHVEWEYWQERRYYGGFELGATFLPSKDFVVTLGSLVIGADFMEQATYYLAWTPTLAFGPIREGLHIELFRLGSKQISPTAGFSAQIIW